MGVLPKGLQETIYSRRSNWRDEYTKKYVAS